MATRSTKSPAAASSDHWSQHVTETSDAMDLKHDVFKQKDPKAIARSLKSSAEHSDRRKSDPYRSAMSMLTFYINRAGHNLEPAQHEILESAKAELRTLFDKPATANPPVAKKVAMKDVVSKKAVSNEAAPTRKAPAAKKAKPARS